MLRDYQRAPQRNHHQDSEQSAEHCHEHHSRELEIHPRIMMAGIVTPTPKAIDSARGAGSLDNVVFKIVASRKPNFENNRKSVIEITATGIEALTVNPL